MAEDFTAKFKVDISDLKKNITEANRQIKVANATFKAETAGMENWEKNADGLASKLKSLDTVLKSQKSVLSDYEDQLERQKKAYNENGERADQLKAKLKELADNGVSKADEEYKKYETALKSVMKEQENNQKAAENLELKILNQKAAVGKTQLSIEKYTKAQQELEDESKDAANDLDKVDRSFDEVGDDAQQSATNIDKADRSLENVGKQAKSTESKFSGLGKVIKTSVVAGFAAMATAVAGGVTALTKATTSAAEYADEINTLSSVTGMSTESIQEYKYAAELVDVSFETLSGSMKKNIKSMSSAKDGAGDAAEAYKKLGVAVTDSEGNMRDSETVYWEAIDALGNIENETERDATAMTLFGKSATELNPLIETGTDNLNKLKTEAQEMGAVMSQDSLDALSNFDDSLQKLKSGASAAKNALGTVLLPQLQDLVDIGVDSLKSFTSEVNAANGDWNKISDIISKNVGKISTEILKKLPTFVEAGSKIVSSLASAILTSLPTLASSATSLLTQFSSYIIEALPTAFNIGATILENLITSLTEALPSLLTSIQESAPKILQSIIDMVALVLESADDIILPIVESIPTFITDLVTTLTKEENINKLIDGAISLLQGLVDALPTVIKSLTDSAETIITSVTSALKTAFPKLLDGAISLVNDLVARLPDILSSLMDAAPSMIELLTTTFLSPDNIAKLVAGAIDVVIKLAENAPKIIADFAAKAPDMIKKIFNTEDGFLSQENIDLLFDKTVELIGTLVENIPELVASITSAAKSIISEIVGALGKNIAQFFGLGEEAGEEFANGLKTVVSAALSVMTFGLAGGSTGNMEISPIETLKELTREMWDGFSDEQKVTIKKSAYSYWYSLDADTQAKLRSMGIHAATGRIFSKSTFVEVGEDGPEAVIPLKNHTEWISLVASKLAHNLSGGGMAIGGGTSLSNQKTINFTQNNYSPEPLSRLDIYRQTESMMELAKEVI